MTDLASLTDLQAHFVRYWSREGPVNIAVGPHETWHERGCPTETVNRMQHGVQTVETLLEAQGIWMLCPKCYVKNGRSDRGTHWVDVSFADRGVLPDQGCHGVNGEPTRWQVSGTGLHDLTTQPSILLGGGCGWHGYITNGRVTEC